MVKNKQVRLLTWGKDRQIWLFVDKELGFWLGLLIVLDESLWILWVFAVLLAGYWVFKPRLQKKNLTSYANPVFNLNSISFNFHIQFKVLQFSLSFSPLI